MEFTRKYVEQPTPPLESITFTLSRDEAAELLEVLSGTYGAYELYAVLKSIPELQD